MAEEEISGSGIPGDSPTEGQEAAQPPAAPPPPPIDDDEAPSGFAAIVGPTINVLFAPAKAWQALDAKPKLAIWIFVWVALVSTILGIWNLPITQQATTATMQYSMRAQGRDVSPEELEQIMSWTLWSIQLMAYIGTPIFIFIMILFFALIMWLGASVMGGSARFSRSFGLAAAGAVIHPVIYSLYVSGILHMSPPEIRRPEDMALLTPTVGPHLLFDAGDTPTWLYTLLLRTDLFNLWWIIIVVSGAQVLLRLKKGAAITLAVGIWGFTTVLAILMAMLQTMSAG
jgi:hypothetical protein